MSLKPLSGTIPVNSLSRRGLLRFKIVELELLRPDDNVAQSPIEVSLDRWPGRPPSLQHFVRGVNLLHALVGQYLRIRSHPRFGVGRAGE